MDKQEQELIAKVFDLESKGILGDLSSSPELFTQFLGFDESQVRGGISYVVGVLKECFDAGHLKVAMSQNDGHLFGYALFFILPTPGYPAYLQKIFVKEAYRNKGIGSGLLNTIIESVGNIALLCPQDKVSFYEKNGFNYCQPYKTPDSENFRFSKWLYRDLVLMGNSPDGFSAPIFLLNDQDINAILSQK